IRWTRGLSYLEAHGMRAIYAVLFLLLQHIFNRLKIRPLAYCFVIIIIIYGEGFYSHKIYLVLSLDTLWIDVLSGDGEARFIILYDLETTSDGNTLNLFILISLYIKIQETDIELYNFIIQQNN
ncbi:hypothetical protein ACJX0J_036852, partial [Zea mays]